MGLEFVGLEPLIDMVVSGRYSQRCYVEMRRFGCFGIPFRQGIMREASPTVLYLPVHGLVDIGVRMRLHWRMAPLEAGPVDSPSQRG